MRHQGYGRPLQPAPADRSRTGPSDQEVVVADRPLDIIQGTLEMLILKALARGPRHGWGVLTWLRERADGDLSLEEGAIYPALHRLEEKGLLHSEWGISEKNRRARFYGLTDRGHRELRVQTSEWSRYIRVIDRIIAEPAL